MAEPGTGAGADFGAGSEAGAESGAGRGRAPLRLHHVPQARSFRVLWLLHEIGEAPEVVRHSLLDGSLRGPDFLALSPAARVPALEVDGRTIFESGAIVEYLCETRPAPGFGPGFAPGFGPGLGRAPGHPERVDWLQWLHFSETIGQHLANLTQQHIVLHEDAMRSPVLMRLEARRLAKTLAVVDRSLAARRPRERGREDGADPGETAPGDWLLPSGFSAVDITVGYGAILGRRFTRLDALPALGAWVARLEARPAFRSALAADGPAELYTRDFYEAPDA